MKQSNLPPFINKKVLSLIKKEEPFLLRNLDFRLLPFFLPLLSRPVFVFYDLSSSVISEGLLLSIKESGVFCDEGFLSSSGSVDGFQGFFERDRNLFLNSLKDGFENHSFVLFPKKLLKTPLFTSFVVNDSFRVENKTHKKDLVSCLESLNYVLRDFALPD